MKSLLKSSLLLGAAILLVPSMAQAGYNNGVMYHHRSFPTFRSQSNVTRYYAQPTYTAVNVAATPNRTSYSSAFQAQPGTTAAAPATTTVVRPVMVATPTRQRMNRTHQIEHGREIIKSQIVQ